MDIFRSLFGITADKIKKTCILAPFITKEMQDVLGIKKLSRGILYASGYNSILSVICTNSGSANVGDAVLHLRETNCKNLIFFGTCGSLNKNAFPKASFVLIDKALSKDSFVDMLLKREPVDVFYPDKRLLNSFYSFGSDLNIKKACALTVGSLKLEEDYLNSINKKHIDVIDMETSAFFAAAKSVRKKAVSFLHVTDHIKDLPYYKAFSKKNISDIKKNAVLAFRALVKILEKFKIEQEK